MSASLSTISFDIDDGIGRLRLARAAVGNAIDLPMAHELALVAQRCRIDPSLRVLVIAGEGAHFCVGGDLRANAASGRAAADYTRDITRSLHAALADFAQLDAVIVTAVHGTVAGAGLGFSLLADLVVATRNARFIAAYTKVSLTPDAGVSFLLPRAIGTQRALDLLLTNRPCLAEEAAAIGLVSRLVDDDALDSATTELTRSLRAGPAGAFATTRRLVRGEVAAFIAHMEQESLRISEQVASAEGTAGMAAFLARFSTNKQRQ